MNTKQILEFMDYLEKAEMWAFTFNDARVWFKESPATLKASLARHTENTLITRITRGIYANPRSAHLRSGNPIGRIACLMRPGKFGYLSLEYALSECGAISQVCTVFTFVGEGKSAPPRRTGFGTLEFCNGALPDMEDVSFSREDGLWRASPMLAYRDLLRIRPNVAHDLVDMESLEEAQQDYEDWKRGAAA